MNDQLNDQLGQLGDSAGNQPPGQAAVVQELLQDSMGWSGVNHRSRLVM